MARAIAHRGPDGAGTKIYKHAALGHTRLAIIDLDSGQQPMTSHDKLFTIVFNGEIYNYPQLRDELLKAGHRFKTRSDTEVILELYRSEGWQGFNKLRGMFAFALWDNRKKSALLVRDPLGIKPLFIKQDQNQQILFASEAKSIFASDNNKTELDTGNLHLLMNFRYLPTDGSLFKGIKQLNPGTVLEWRPDNATVQHQLSINSNVAHSLLDSITESVKLHLTADVEVAAYLSGGIDSAAVVALAKQFSPKPLRTFTLNVGDDPNEAKNAARTAELLGVDNIQKNVAGDLATILPRLVWHLEVPKINALQVSQLAGLTANYTKVALSGLGGDELFHGYNAHHIFHKAYRVSHLLPRWTCQLLGNVGASLNAAIRQPVWTESERALRMLQNMGDWPRIYGLLRNVWDSPKLRQQIYGPRMLDASLPDCFGVIENLWPNDTNPLNAMATFERRYKMVNDLLWQEDRISMAEGLEVRVPFVDAPLIANTLNIDIRDMTSGKRPKDFMRNIVKPILPDEILNRPKSGFQVSSPDFYHQQLTGLAQQWLSDKRIQEYGLFNPHFVKHVLSLPATKTMRWHYFVLYLMLLTHLWIDIFEKRSW